jgi:Zn-dependent hydrolases, including glyoxylases
MKIADGVEMLELTANMTGQVNSIYPVLLTEGNEAVLIDTGFPGQWEILQQAITAAGTDVSNITKIIMTHHDIDHIGNLSTLVKSSDHRAEVLAHEQEKPYIQGDLPPCKASRAESQENNESFKHMSPEQRQAILKVFQNFKMFTVPVDHTLQDREVLPWEGGITVIHTPGHTPGHICLYLSKSKVLIAGDALAVQNGCLVPGPAALNQDTELARRSLGKLADLDVSFVICYHGGLYTNGSGQRLGEISNI